MPRAKLTMDDSEATCESCGVTLDKEDLAMACLKLGGKTVDSYR